MKNILNAPYPFPYLKQNLKSAIFVSFCITIFLLIFQPFGLNTIQPSYVRIKIIIGYGLVTFIAVGAIAFAMLIVEKYTKNEQSWNVYKHILLLLSNLLLVSAGNFIYSHLIFGLKPNLTNLLWFTFYTFSVGIFPIVFIVIIHQFNQLKKYAVLADSFRQNHQEKEDFNSTKEEKIKIRDYKQETVLILHNESFLFAEASENYCEIYYYEVDKIKKLMIRSTISNVSEQLKPYESIFKCHRSYIVNLNHVENVIGNAQGLKIKLKNIENQIPVSRNLIKEFKDKWMNKKN